MKKHFKTKWEDHFKQLTARVLVAALTVTTCMQTMVFPAHAESYGKNGVVREMSSQQIVDDMGLGYNIGNTFDSIGSWITIDDPWEYQRAWNNDPVSKHFIQKVHQAGFKTIRLPVSWAKWIDSNNQIDSGYMSAVQTVVDWCMEEDMYVILNIHHDSGAADNSWVRNIVTDFDGISRKYADVWTQIANNFAGYGDHLIFEGMNEVEFPAASSKSRQFELLNHLNQLFVDTVRATGGNNAKRHLLIPGFNTDIKQTSDRRFQMPNDPAGHCILSIHYYSPSPFAVAEHNVDWCEPVTTWGSEEDIAEVRANLDILASNFLSKGVPVIIGEYGVLTEDNKEKESIYAYLKRIPELVKEYGMCPVLWDTSNAGDMKFIERNSGDFYDPQIRANYAELARKFSNGDIPRKDFSVLNYKEVDLPVSPGGWVSLESFEPSKVLGIRFRLSCSSDWDSYGGGGIWIDGYTNTPQYRFNSVFDEVTYMFTEEERGRLGDRLGILLWWTDETKGGSRVKDLSFENGRVTLLYAEGENISSAGPYTNTGVRASGGGGGGGGGGSSRPNNSTNPGSLGNQYGDREIKAYPYSIKGLSKDGYSTVVDIRDLCPDFELGDEIHLTIYPLTDDWASGAIEIPGLNDNGFGGGKQEFTFTPAQNKMEAKLWVTGDKRSYFHFAMRCEVTKKGENTGGYNISSGGEKKFTWEELIALSGTSASQIGNRLVRITIASEVPDKNTEIDTSVTLIKDNLVKMTGSLKNYTEDWSNGGAKTITDSAAGLVLTGKPKKGSDAVVLKNNSSRPVHIKFVNVEITDEEEDLGLLHTFGSGTVEFGSDISMETEVVNGQTEGWKFYVQADEPIDKTKYEGLITSSGSGGATYESSGEKQIYFDFRKDGQGDYIFIPGVLNTVNFNLWGKQEGFAVVKIVKAVDVSNLPSEEPEVVAEPETDEYGNKNYHVPNHVRKPVGIKIENVSGDGGILFNGQWGDDMLFYGLNSSKEYVFFTQEQSENCEFIQAQQAVNIGKFTYLYWESLYTEEVETQTIDGKNGFILPSDKKPVLITSDAKLGEVNIYISNDGVSWYQSSNAGYWDSFAGGVDKRLSPSHIEGKWDTVLARISEVGNEVNKVALVSVNNGENPTKLTFYYDSDPTPAVSRSINTIQAIEKEQGMFYFPVKNVPVGIRYSTSEQQEGETGYEDTAVLRMAVIHEEKEPRETDGGSSQGAEDIADELLFVATSSNAMLPSIATSANAIPAEEEGSFAKADPVEDLAKGELEEESLPLATAANASWGKATPANASSNWKAVAKNLEVSPEREEYYEFTPAERKAIGSFIDWAEDNDSEEPPVMYFDLGTLDYWVERVFLVFEEDEILDADGFEDEEYLE